MKGKKNTASVKEYLDNVVPKDLSGGRWSPPQVWNRVHRNDKSSTGGHFHIETMKDSNGRCIAKVVGAEDQKLVIIDDDGNSANGPSFPQIMAKWKAHYA